MRIRELIARRRGLSARPTRRQLVIRGAILLAGQYLAWIIGGSVATWLGFGYGTWLYVFIGPPVFVWMILSLIVVVVQSVQPLDHPECPTCKYDLRGSPGPGCPECGNWLPPHYFQTQRPPTPAAKEDPQN